MSSGRWIPLDVKIHWFSFLDATDLARASQVCRAWASLVEKTNDAIFATTVGAPPPQLSRAAKTRFSYRLQHPEHWQNMGYLLSWAAGSRGAGFVGISPFIHANARLPSLSCSGRVHTVSAQAPPVSRRPSRRPWPAWWLSRNRSSGVF
jgi:hypothetical protein